LAEIAAEVFEIDAETDLESGTDFTVQNSESTHYMDIAIRAVLQMNGLQFRGNKKVNINDGGDILPENVLAQSEIQGQTWFDILNPSKLVVPGSLATAKALQNLQILTDPCTESWANRPEEGKPLTAEALYQFTRVVWVLANQENDQ
jgi:hypothetical protein